MSSHAAGASLTASSVGAGGKRAAALGLLLITLAFWIELLLERDREGFLGSLRRILVVFASSVPAVVQVGVCAGAPFVALGLALVSLRDPSGRRAGYAALAVSALFAALVVWAALGGVR